VRGVVTKHGVVCGQYRAAAIAENRVNTFIGEHLNNDIGTTHARTRECVSGVASGFCEIVHSAAVILRKYWIFRECLLIYRALQYSLCGVSDRRNNEHLVSIACIRRAGKNFHATRNFSSIAKRGRRVDAHDGHVFVTRL
jgi:hypothetical protein